MLSSCMCNLQYECFAGLNPFAKKVKSDDVNNVSKPLLFFALVISCLNFYNLFLKGRKIQIENITAFQPLEFIFLGMLSFYNIYLSSSLTGDEENNSARILSSISLACSATAFSMIFFFYFKSFYDKNLYNINFSLIILVLAVLPILYFSTENSFIGFFVFLILNIIIGYSVFSNEKITT